jgi:hypothetical protein
MQHIVEQFLHWYFWVFLFCSIAIPVVNVYHKAKGMKLKDQSFFELLIATTLFIVSIFY